MLEDLRQYTSLGSAGYYWEVLELFYNHPNTDWTRDSITAHFRGRIIDGRDIFDGGIRLLEASKVLEYDNEGIYHTTHAFKQRLHSEEHCRGRILDALLSSMKDDEHTFVIFSSEFCSFDFVNNVIQVDRAGFGLQFANIRDVLISLRFLLPHPNYPEKSFAINKHHRVLFDKYLTEGIRRRRVSPEQLRSIQNQQQERGLLGERFAFSYEGGRTGRPGDIEWIATYDAAAGFDIMSFETAESVLHDRFIEVKTYSGEDPYFYWSRNEMEVATEKGDTYFLYLVDLDKIDSLGYVPIIIQNPAVNVLDNDNDWHKVVDKYRINRA